MKHTKTRCLTQVFITDDIKPSQRWKLHNQTICGTYTEVREHRVPFFLSLHAHLIVERTLETIFNEFQPKPFSKTVNLFYDLIHGLVSGYNTKEISNFWRER